MDQLLAERQELRPQCHLVFTSRGTFRSCRSGSPPYPAGTSKPRLVEPDALSAAGLVPSALGGNGEDGGEEHAAHEAEVDRQVHAGSHSALLLLIRRLGAVASKASTAPQGLDSQDLEPTATQRGGDDLASASQAHETGQGDEGQPHGQQCVVGKPRLLSDMWRDTKIFTCVHIVS